ncbi:MAG: helix-turn-helix domain-containing protein [Clostridiales bacterium]|nr:helix-turn-helix domain-containing protein [Clostridiales bacterium]
MISEDTFPTADELAMAKKAYFDWERSEAESLSDFVCRRRTVDLSYLVGDAMDACLTKTEKTAVKKYYYGGKKIFDIAEELNVSTQSVRKTLGRALGKIGERLKYVVEYQYDLKNIPFLPLAVREAVMLDAIRRSSPLLFGEKIKKLRESENISVSALCASMDISETDLSALENGDRAPTAKEIIAFSSYFDVSADHLLKGGICAFGKSPM